MIFVSGMTRSGKSTVSSSPALARSGFQMLDVGPVIRGAFPESDIRDRMRSTEILKGHLRRDPDVLWEAVVREIYRRMWCEGLLRAQDLIVAGTRIPGGIDYIKARFGIGRRNLSVYIDAPEHVLLERYNASGGARLAMADFQKLLDGDFRGELGEIKRSADYVLDGTRPMRQVEADFACILRRNGYSIAA